MSTHHVTERYPTTYLDRCGQTELTGTHLITMNGPRPEYHMCSREVHRDGRHECRCCGHVWLTGRALTWLPRTRDYVELWGIDPALIEDAVADPFRMQLEPATAHRHYDLKRFRRGDLEVCVGYADPENPVITWVRIHLPHSGRGGSRSGGAVGGKTAPTTVGDLEARIRAAGYAIVLGGKHRHVLRGDGSLLVTLGCTPSDARSLTNAWKQFERAVGNDTSTGTAS